MTARRAKRENGGLGEDPPGSTMTYRQVLRTWMYLEGVKSSVPGGVTPQTPLGSLHSGLVCLLSVRQVCYKYGVIERYTKGSARQAD
jgi:hypothetical protein